MAKKLYRFREPGATYFPGNGRYYAEHETDSLDDWAKSDIQAALISGLIEEVKVESPTPPVVTESKGVIDDGKD